MPIKEIRVTREQADHLMEAIRALDTVEAPEKLHALEAMEENGYLIPGFTKGLRQLGQQQHQYLENGQQYPKPLETTEIIEKFIKYKQSAGIRPKSIQNYHQVLYAFARQYPSPPSTPEEIEAFLTDKPSDSYRLSIYRVLSVFYKYANERLGIPNTMNSIQKPRVKHKEPDCLTDQQAKMILAAIQTDRERALVYSFLGLGLRLSEPIRLNICDIGENTLKITGKERDESMPLLPEIRDALLKLAGNRDSNEPVFLGQRGRLHIDTAERNIKQLFIRAGVYGVRQSPKVFRSTFATMALAAGCDYYIVKRLMRHSGGWDVTHLHYIRKGNLNLLEYLGKYSPLRLLNKTSERLLAYQLGFDFTADSLIKVSKKIKGVNQRYIKSDSTGFKETLESCLRVRYGDAYFPFASRYKLDDLPKQRDILFANISFPLEIRTPEIPSFLQYAPFLDEVREVFAEAHEKMKVIKRQRS